MWHLQLLTISTTHCLWVLYNIFTALSPNTRLVHIIDWRRIIIYLNFVNTEFHCLKIKQEWFWLRDIPNLSYKFCLINMNQMPFYMDRCDTQNHCFTHHKWQDTRYLTMKTLKALTNIAERFINYSYYFIGNRKPCHAY